MLPGIRPHYSVQNRSFLNHSSLKLSQRSLPGALACFQIKRHLYTDARWGERVRYFFKGINGLESHEIKAAPKKLCRDVIYFQKIGNYHKALKAFLDLEIFLPPNLETEQQKTIFLRANSFLTKQDKRSYLFKNVLKDFCGKENVDRIREGFIENGIRSYQNNNFLAVSQQWKAAQTLEEFDLKSAKEVQLKHLLGISHFKRGKYFKAQREFHHLLNWARGLSKSEKAVIVNQLAICSLAQAFNYEVRGYFESQLDLSRERFLAAKALDQSTRLYATHFKIVDALKWGPHYGSGFEEMVQTPSFEKLEPISILNPIRSQLTKNLHETHFQTIAVFGHEGTMQRQIRQIKVERKANVEMLEKLDQLSIQNG